MRRKAILLAALVLAGGLIWTQQVLAQRVTLSVSLGASEVHEAWYRLYEEQHPNVRIESFVVPGASMEDFLRARAAAGTLPDLFAINSNAFGHKFMADGFAADLADTAAAANTLPGLREPFTTPAGQVYGIPVGTATTWMYYNRDLIAEAGIAAIPTTWDEFIAALEKLKSARIAGTIIDKDGFGNTWFSYIFAQKVVPGEPDFVAKIERGEFDFTQPGVADIFTKVKYLTDNGLAHKAFLSTNNAQASSLFLQGRAATYFAGSWQASQLLDGDVDAGIFFPAVKDAGEATMGVLVPETGAGINAASENLDAAFDLLNWMFGEGYAFYQNGMGNIPSVVEVMGEVKLDPRVIRVLDEVKGYPQTRLWFQYLPSETLPLVNKLLDQVLLGDLTPQEAAEELHNAARDAVMQ